MSGTTERPSSPTPTGERPARPYTSPRARALGVTTYVVLLVAWSSLIGIPNDPLGVFLWIWGALVAWDVQGSREWHLRFPRDWWPVLLGLVVYWLTRGLVDELGLPVHVQMPIDVDRWLAGLLGSDGTRTPTEILQSAWCADPCTADLPHRWFDTVLTTVYASHFLVGLTLAAVLWVRNRDEWWRWMRRYLAINYAALVVYLTYPMAPPWMASRDGFIGEVHRITSRGWAGTGLDRANIVLQGMGNQVAAMPSLHAGIAFLVAIYGVQRLRHPLRWLLLAYPAAMSLALVYFAEHYVVDVLAGGLLALVVTLGVGRWERRLLPVERPRETAPGAGTVGP
jgi:membrane-associated phospholipid phosphatase